MLSPGRGQCRRHAPGSIAEAAAAEVAIAAGLRVSCPDPTAPPPLLADLDVPPLSAAPSCACQAVTRSLHRTKPLDGKP